MFAFKEKLFKYVTTMVCISVKGKPIVGVIHFPFSNTTHWAWVGNGNSYNAHFKKHIEAEDRLKIIVSRSHKGEVDREIRKRFRGKQVDIEVAGGAGYKVHEVAMGNVDVYFHVTQISKWDICAGNAILDALGGRMVTLDNQKITYGNTKTAVNDNGLIGARSHKVLDGVFNLS